MSEYHYADDVAELTDAYPIGVVVEVEGIDGDRYRARVTGYSEVVNPPDRKKYLNPGARLCVSTNPIDGEKVEDSGVEGSRGAAVPMERIIGAVDERGSGDE